MNKIAQVTNQALASSHLIPIKTTRIHKEPHYLINMVAGGKILKTSALENKVQPDPADKKESEKTVTVQASTAIDPFRPFEKELCIAEKIEPHHAIVLNKFCVVEYHLLLLTREFEKQTNHLNRRDFAAVVGTMARLTPDWVVFYNRGLYSGASQPHKHIQLIPGDRSTRASFEEGNNDTVEFPLIPIFDALVEQDSTISKVPFWHFKHAFMSIKHIFDNDIEQRAEQLTDSYVKLLRSIDVYEDGEHNVAQEGEERFLSVSCLNGAEMHEISLSRSKFTNYNFLMNRNWMLLVPRSRENYMGISCNSLAFLHGFFAKNEQQLKLITEEIGLDNLLPHVTFPSDHQFK